MAARRTWKCRKCNTTNLSGKRKCSSCGKLKPKKRIPAHRRVLTELTYDDFIQINGGEFCWIHRSMGLPDPPRSTRLHRDHDHRTGKPRGLLCYTCNRLLGPRHTVDFIEAAAKYLRQAENYGIVQ